MLKMELSEKDLKIFIDSLNKETQPNENLKSALKYYKNKERLEKLKNINYFILNLLIII
jgi:hypothetical protein